MPYTTSLWFLARSALNCSTLVKTEARVGLVEMALLLSYVTIMMIK